ncbi:MAG TPA: ABC transporter permease [Solirubrobacteraceae bacterium]|nr:ABC transporter permease [Solirubrobacteraceae bacterium]
MEASPFRPSRLREPGERPGAAQEAWGNFTGPLGDFLSETGELAAFTGRTLLELRGVWRYAAEIFRQAGILIVGSALVIWFMEFVMGLECATEADYVLRGYGATAYSGIFTGWCAVRECVPYMWGYIVAAKVGCGLVAEVGSMRINDEIDAMETMGINPMRYIVGTRLMAAWITFPWLIIVGCGFHFLADYFVIVVQIHEVSKGGWELIHWSANTPMDFLYMEVKCMVSGTLIVLVGLYYGYRAKGGPVGVGTATARSMILNLVQIHVTGSLLTMIFWGLNPNIPAGG